MAHKSIYVIARKPRRGDEAIPRQRIASSPLRGFLAMTVGKEASGALPQVKNSSSCIFLGDSCSTSHMRRLTQTLLALSIAVIAVGFAACSRTPTSPPTTTPAGPSITLTLPDTAALDAPVNMSVHMSDSMKPNWLLTWHFGDSTSTRTSGVNATHFYLHAGVFKVEVDLIDTSSGKTLSQVFGGIRIGNGPTLILMVPDSVRSRDIATIAVRSSMPLRAGWVYTWTFGDSTSLTSRDSTVEHSYLHEGVYSVKVNLIDTNTNGLLALMTSSIRVFTLHFDYSILTTMHSITIECYGMDTCWGYGSRSGSNYNINSKKPNSMVTQCSQLRWNGTQFQFGHYFSEADSSQGQPIRTLSTEDTISGQVDGSSSNLLYVYRSFYNDQQYYFPPSADDSSLQMELSNIRFKSESDSDVVFEQIGPVAAYASSYGNTTWDRLEYENRWSFIDWGDASVPSRVTVRFHR